MIYAGTDPEGDGQLRVKNQSGQPLINAGVSKSGNGALVELYNKTGESIVQLYADDYGNGVVGAYNRGGEGRTLESR